MCVISHTRGHQGSEQTVGGNIELAMNSLSSLIEISDYVHRDYLRGNLNLA